MSIKRQGKDLSARYWGKKVVIEIRKGLKLIWGLVRGYLFTSDGKALKTSNGKILKPKQTS